MKLLEKNKDFFDLTYQVCREIPEGRVTSYGAIAKYLGAVRGARMVGWAMNNAHSMPDIPAHRVVNRNGQLTGKIHFSPPEAMEQLLKQEGINVENDTIINFKEVYWDPSIELSL